MTLTEAFAKFGAKLRNRMFDYSAVAENGSLVFSCWEFLLKPKPDGLLRYEDKLSRWSRLRDPGKSLFRMHLRQAFDGRLQVRLVVATTKDKTAILAGSEARTARKTFSVRGDLVGKVILFDGDRFVI